MDSAAVPHVSHDAATVAPRFVMPARPLRGLAVLVLESILIFTYGLLANGVFLASSLLRLFSPALAYRLNSATAGALWLYMQRLCERKHGARITFSGDALPQRESALLIANHCSYSDYYLIHAVALRHGMLPFMRYFAKFELVYLLPVFGLSLWLIDMVLVRRNWARDAKSTEVAFRAIKRHKSPVWLVTYLEGHRRTEQRLAESAIYAKKSDKAVLSQVLLPRTKGFVAAVAALRDDSQIRHVYDFTLAYRSPDGVFQRAPSLATIHSAHGLSPAWSFHVHVKRYAMVDLPRDNGGLARWVEQVWLEKDQLLGRLDATWPQQDPGLTIGKAIRQ